MKITTVLGNIKPLELGFCQSHEHLFISGSIDDPEKSLAELLIYRQSGGRALVDAQPVGCGRNAAALSEIAQKSGVHIIASTGFHKCSYYPENHWIHTVGEDALSRLFIGELEKGMYLDGDTAFPRNQGCACAGQIKTALDVHGLTPVYKKLFGAAANAAKSTGFACMIHVEQGSDPLGLADFLENQGLAPERMIFCHLDRAVPDIGLHRELCKRGSYLEYDTICRPKYHDDEKELLIISNLLEAGYEKQLLMSLDTTRARLRSYGGEPGITYIIDSFVPMMREHGISKTQIELLFVENPARVFACCVNPQ